MTVETYFAMIVQLAKCLCLSWVMARSLFEYAMAALMLPISSLMPLMKTMD